MSEKLCTLRTKGGGSAKYTETSLWTNSSPASSFSGQNVTLSDSIDNYKYVSIKYRASISVADEANVIVLVSDLKKSVGHNSTNHIAIETGAQYSSGTIISRMVTYVNSTTIGFSMAYQLNAATSNAGWAIPLEILGLNELDHGKIVDYAVISSAVGTGASPTSQIYTSNSNVFTVSANYYSSTITVLEEGLYAYTAIAQTRGSGTASVSIGSQTVATQQGAQEVSGEIQISANTVCTVSCGNKSNVTENAVLTLLKKS